MAYWLDDYPVMRSMPKQIAAADYNRIRLGLLRERLPWHLPLKPLRCLVSILDESAWLCVDECQNNLPILAWTNFKTKHRVALDTPVECELRLYHMHAGLVMGTALDALVEVVTEHCKLQASGRYPVSSLKI